MKKVEGKEEGTGEKRKEQEGGGRMTSVGGKRVEDRDG